MIGQEVALYGILVLQGGVSATCRISCAWLVASIIARLAGPQACRPAGLVGSPRPGLSVLHGVFLAVSGPLADRTRWPTPVVVAFRWLPGLPDTGSSVRHKFVCEVPVGFC